MKPKKVDIFGYILMLLFIIFSIIAIINITDSIKLSRQTIANISSSSDYITGYIEGARTMSQACDYIMMEKQKNCIIPINLTTGIYESWNGKTIYIYGNFTLGSLPNKPKYNYSNVTILNNTYLMRKTIE